MRAGGRPGDSVSFRRASIAALIVAALTPLVGCDPNPPPPDWSIRVDGTVVEVVACDGVVGESLRAFALQESGERWRKFWELEGTITIDSDPLVMGETADGAEDVLVDWEAARGTRGVLFFLSGVEGNPDRVRAEFLFPSEYPTASRWLNVDGTVRDEPCVE